MSDPVERISPETETPDEILRNKLEELLPGAIVEGNLDAHRLADLLNVKIDGITERPERFGLNWAGKNTAIKALRTPSLASLAPDLENSVDWDTAQNVFIEGDNLEVLKLLQKAYNDKVKLIYIDPPYNTGNDFVYNDDFSDPVKHYLEVTGQIDAEGNRLVANTETTGRKHSNWLNMMYSRLTLARNLLTEDGLIFISLDDNEISNLKLLLEEVFGPENFVTQFIWKKGGTGKNDSKFAVVEHEYILAFARNIDKAAFGLDLEGEVSTSYNFEDEFGKYSLVRLDSKTLGYVTSLDFEITDSLGKVYSPEQPEGKTKIARWRWSQQKVKDQFDQLVFKGEYVYTKNYQKEGAKPRSLLVGERFGVTRTGSAEAEAVMGDMAVFDFPKPVRLIRHLIQIASDKDSVVLDFFAGSGTTGHAVLEQNHKDGGNRKFICVNINEPTNEKSAAFQAGIKSVSDITKLRLRAALSKIPQPNFSGLRSLILTKSSFTDTMPSGDPNHLLLYKETLDPNSTDDEIVTEVLIKTGVTLDQPWVRKTLNKTPVVISGGVAVALARKVTDELVASLLEEEAHLVVFLEDAFMNADDVKARAFYEFQRSNKTMKTM